MRLKKIFTDKWKRNFVEWIIKLLKIKNYTPLSPTDCVPNLTTKTKPLKVRACYQICDRTSEESQEMELAYSLAQQLLPLVREGVIGDISRTQFEAYLQDPTITISIEVDILPKV